MRFTLQPLVKRTAACQTIALLFASVVAFSQENTEEKLLLVKANELVFSNPDETIKIANHLLKKNEAENTIPLNILLSKSYKVKGDYPKSVSYIFDVSSGSGKINDSLAIEIAFVKADLSRKMHLYSQMDGYLNDVKSLASDVKNEEYVRYVALKSDLESVYAFIERKQYTKAKAALENTLNKHKGLSLLDNSRMDIEYLNALIYKDMNKFAESRECFNKTFSYYKKQKVSSVLLEARVYLGLGQVYFHEKNYEKAVNMLLLSLDKAKKLNNSPLQEVINYELSENYFAMGNKAEHQKYFSAFKILNEANINMETEAVNSMYNLISEEQESNYVYQESKLKFYAYMSLISLTLIVLSGIILYRVNKAKRRQLKEIIGYLEVTNKLLVKPDSDKKEPNKKISIPTETEQVILSKLKKFEATTKYTHKDMSLATLSAQLDVNTKYLSEIINKHYHDNFNTYINKLRINYIIEKLKNEPEYLNYKISYLAEECGFSSHSSFATIFKSITGIAPTVFIDLIGKEVILKKA